MNYMIVWRNKTSAIYINQFVFAIACLFLVVCFFGCNKASKQLFSTELISFDFGDSISINLPKGSTFNKHQDTLQGISRADIYDLRTDGIIVHLGDYQANSDVTFNPKKELESALLAMNSNYKISSNPIINTGRFNQMVAIWSEFSFDVDGKSIPVLSLAIPLPQDPKICRKVFLISIIDQRPPKNNPNARITQIANSIKIK